MSFNKEVPGRDNIIENADFNRQNAAEFRKKVVGSKPYGLNTALHVNYDVIGPDDKIVSEYQVVLYRDLLPPNAVNIVEYKEEEPKGEPFTGASGEMFQAFHVHGDVTSYEGGIPIVHRKVK